MGDTGEAVAKGALTGAGLAAPAAASAGWKIHQFAASTVHLVEGGTPISHAAASSSVALPLAAGGLCGGAVGGYLGKSTKDYLLTEGTNPQAAQVAGSVVGTATGAGVAVAVTVGVLVVLSTPVSAPVVAAAAVIGAVGGLFGSLF